MTLDETETVNRQRRHLTDVAIGQATRGEWEAAVSTNQQILELGGDTDAFNRLGKALAELGRHAEALDSGARTRAVAFEFGSLALLGLLVALLLRPA